MELPGLDAKTPPAPPPSGDGGTAVALGDLQQPRTRAALALWQVQRGSRAMPARTDMTPRLMRKFLNAMALVEVIDGDFRFRVVGDGIATQQKLPLIGKTLTEVDRMVPGFGTFLRGVYETTAQSGEPHAYRGSYLRTADKHPFQYEAVILPLGNDGSTVDHIIVVSV